MLDNPISRWKARCQGLILRVLRGCEDLLEAAKRQMVPAPLTLFRDVTAPWLASAICVAARLRLADHLGRQSLPVALLAERAGVSTADLVRLLDILRAHGYFRLDQQGRVSATPLSLALSREVAGSFAELQGRGWYRQAFSSSHVLEGWRRGQNPFEVAAGRHFFDFLEQDRAAEALFSAAMADVTRFCTPYLAAEISLGKRESLLDVGGGDGELARALARRYPDNVMAVVDRAMTDTSLCGRTPNYRFHQGDFFEGVPYGYNHLFLKNILHDWDDEKAVAILVRCRQAVAPGGRLTVIECLLPEPGDSTLGRAATFALDWNVWLTLSGRERPASDYRRLLEAAGWAWQSQRPTATPYHLLEAVAR
jgi:hypothetical protein